MKSKFSPAAGLDDVAGELIDSVLDHLDNDCVSLRACTLVSSSWHSFARCRVLHTVVCRPDTPHLSLRHLSDFLFSTPDVVPHIRSLKVIGSKPASEVKVAVEDVVPLLSALPNLESLSLERVPLFTRAGPHGPPIKAALLSGSQSFTINLCSINYTDSTDSFFRVLRDCLGVKPIRAVLRFASRDDRFSLPAFLNILGSKIVYLSCNLLGSLGDMGMLSGNPGGGSIYDQLEPLVGVPPCTSVEVLDLYFTLSAFSDQLVMLMGQFSATAVLATFLAPSVPIRHVTLRFQRFGPHTKTTEWTLKAILDPGGWFSCHGVMEGLLLQFKHLETLTCILCDDGFTEQYGDYVLEDTTSATSGSIEEEISSEEEYAAYESFVKTSFPQFLARGILRIQRAQLEH